MIFQPFPTQNPLKNPKNDPPSSILALITSITRGFLTFFMIFGEMTFFVIFMIKWGDVFFHESSTFMKKWTGDDFRLMTRVLPRPLVLQGGKSYRNQQARHDQI